MNVRTASVSEPDLTRRVRLADARGADSDSQRASSRGQGRRFTPMDRKHL